MNYLGLKIEWFKTEDSVILGEMTERLKVTVLKAVKR